MFGIPLDFYPTFNEVLACYTGGQLLFIAALYVQGRCGVRLI